METELSEPAADPNPLSERQARLIIENAVDYAIVGIDLAGAMTSWNVGAERIMGWSALEAIGKPADLFFTPEDVAADIPAAEMGAAVRHGRGIDERWHMRRDGSRFWANGEMLPLRRADGELEGYVKILRDRILVVEDNADVGSFATQALSELGYETKLAVDAASALVELGQDGNGFDLVFSDVVMPGMSGIELRDEIGRRHPDLPVVLASGFSSVLAESDDRNFELLPKPYSLDELARALARASRG